MKKVLKRMDMPLLILTLLFTVFGLIMVYSSSNITAVLRYNRSQSYFFVRQLIFVVISYIFGFAFLLHFPTKGYKKLSLIALITIICSLVYVLIYGTVANGARSWLGIGSFGIQPTEFAKVILILYMAIFYGDRCRKLNNKYAPLIPLMFAVIIFVLVAIQPDFGGAVIIAFLAFMIFLSIPLPSINRLKIFKIIGIGCVIAGLFLLLSGGSLLNSTQMKRFQYQNPCSRYKEKTGYQVCNGLIAISNGGFFGLGLGNSTQKYLYLPEAHTDFIFPIIVEEFGILGGLIILGGYVLVLYRILVISKKSETLRGSIICYGTFIFLIAHIFVNLVGVLGLLPLTGVPLPFLSYGGSFMLCVLTLLFLVQRVNIENEILKNKRELQNL